MDQLKKDYKIDIRWRGFPFHPEIPEEGLPLEQLFPDMPVPVTDMAFQMKQKAAEFGLPMRAITRVSNSRLSQELGLWAISRGMGDAFHAASFEAYFAVGKNIALIPVLLEITQAADLPVDEAKRVLEERTFQDPVDRDWSLAVKKGISAIPTLVLNRHRLVGAQPYDILKKFMEECGVDER